MISINTKDELSLYDLEGKWNDYIGVQKEVLKALRDEKYFDEFNVTNIESNMCVRIIINELQMDDELVKIRIAIKKKVATNYFWIHNIDEY